MCDVPSIAVFCSESIECFPGTASKFFLKLLVTIPVAPVITGIIIIIIIIIIIESNCPTYCICFFLIIARCEALTTLLIKSRVFFRVHGTLSIGR